MPDEVKADHTILEVTPETVGNAGGGCDSDRFRPVQPHTQPNLHESCSRPRSGSIRGRQGDLPSSEDSDTKHVGDTNVTTGNSFTWHRTPLPVLFGLVESDPEKEQLGLLKTCAWAVSFAVIYALLAYGCLHFTVNDFSSFWPPNGVYVGAMLASPPKLRRIIPFPMVVTIFLLNIVWGWPWYISFAWVGVNTVESIVVSLVTIATATLLSGPGVIDFTKKLHLVAFGVGVLACLVTANLGGGMTTSLINPQKRFSSAYLRWLGRNFVGISLCAPIIVSLRHSNINDIRHFFLHQRRKLFTAMALTMLLVACPVLSIFLIDAAVSSAIVGLYLSYPFVLYAGALLGVFGASSATFLVGLASASATLLRSQTSPPSSETDLPLTQQLIWVQLFLAVLIFTALTFVTILSERDKAYEHVENMVRVRTGELVEALKRLDAAKERAETTARDKATFLSFLCHELRNPLHAITNMAEFLLEDLKDGHRDRKAASLGQPRDSDEEFLRSTFMSESPLTSNPVCAPDRCSSRSSVATPDSQARAIKLSSEYMLALVNDVLDMGRFEAGRVDLERIPVDLHALLDNNVECARELVRAHGVHFTTDIGADVPKWVETDPVRLQQVLNNLVSNAYKFTPEGGKITLTVKVENSRELDWNGDKVGRKGNIGAGDEAKDNPTEGDILGYMSSDQTLQSATEITPSTVSRSTSAAAESTTTCVSLLFSVSDTGIGIDPAIVSTLFRPYAQAAVSTMREYGGSGLGLAITDRIIWLMGGQVWVDSEMGKGSTFTFRIPVSMVEEPPGGGEGWTFGAGNGGKRRAKGRGSEWRKDGAVDGDGPVIAPVRKEDVEAVLDAVHVVSIGDEVCGTHSVDLRGELEGAKDTLDVADTNGAPAPAPLSVTLSSGSLPSPAPNAADDTLLRPSILVVDDSTINRSILIRMLKRQLPEKYLIEEAENGQEAVEKVRRRLMRSGGVEANYRIIFMDIVMPILDGYQATHLIRTRLHCTSPVVITTANQVSGNLEAQEKLRQIGADEAVGKPFMKDKLIEVLRRYNVL